MTRTTRKRFDGDLRRALLDAALDVLVERGAAALSLRELSRTLGVSPAAPAYHFSDKAALVTAIACEGLDQLAEAMAHGAQLVGDDPVDRLTAAGVAYVVFADTHPGHFEVMFRHDLVNASDPTYMESGEGAIGVLLDAVNDCQANGWAPDAEAWAVATQSWAVMHGIATLHAQGALARVTGDRSPADVAAAISHALEAAYRPQPAS